MLSNIFYGLAHHRLGYLRLIDTIGDPAAMGGDVAGQAQGAHCRADTDNPARPSLTDKSVLR